MNVVVLDSAALAGEPDFPMLDLPKFGWQQYPQLDAAEAAERCWRADVVITVQAPVDQKTIEGAFKLKLIAVAGADFAHIDLEAAKARGIQVCRVPGLDPADRSDAEAICREVVENINAFVRGEPRNLVV